jgi:hypothetical protein
MKNKHNEQINNQNIDKSECFGVKFVKIYPEMTSQYFLMCQYFWPHTVFFMVANNYRIPESKQNKGFLFVHNLNRIVNF